MRTRRTMIPAALLGGVLAGWLVAGNARGQLAGHTPGQEPMAGAPAWAMNATIIEACSCPMFCQCYFNAEPAAHHEHGGQHYCRANNVFHVNRGHYGDVDLAGAKFWVAGDLGESFGDGDIDWTVLHFDPAVSPEQRQGIQAALAGLYPIKVKSQTVGEDAPIHWEATGDRAVARLDGGRLGEVVLQATPGRHGGPVVIHNAKYFGEDSNDGFVLMKNEIEAYRGGDKPFEYRGTTGFMLTFDIRSKEEAAAQRNQT